MFKFFILTTLLIVSYANVLPRVAKDGRIAGGTAVDILEIPYQTSLQLDYYDIGSYIPICAGSVLTQRTILTAAHCSLDTLASKWIVRAGSNFSDYGGQSRSVPKILNHPDYERATDDYDISLFFLSSSLTIDGIKTAIIPLPAQSQKVEDGELAVVAGWGMTEFGIPSSFLRKITIPTINQKLCSDAYIDINPVTERMICAGNFGQDGKYTCSGDSGGPMTVNGTLIGITSWGYGCRRPNYPGVFTRVPYFREWIDAEKI